MLILLVCTGPAFSYILPAEQIVGYMIDNLGCAGSLQVTQKTVTYDSALEGGMFEVDETLYYNRPDRFRSEASTPAGERVRVAGPEGYISISKGKIISEAESRFDPFKDPLLYQKTGLVLERLEALDVNIEVVSLGRFRDKVAYVIGAEYPDQSVPQIWIEKETFRPIRYVVRGGDAVHGVLEEIEYTDYAPADKDRWYPGRILFYQHGELVQAYVLETLRLNANLPEDMFDIAHLKTMHESVEPGEPAHGAAHEIDEVKKTLRDFRRAFE
jgi:hypothetical protein